MFIEKVVDICLRYTAVLGVVPKRDYCALDDELILEFQKSHWVKAIVNIDKNEEISYAYWVNGQYVPGKYDANKSYVPGDLINYFKPGTYKPSYIKTILNWIKTVVRPRD